MVSDSELINLPLDKYDPKISKDKKGKNIDDTCMQIYDYLSSRRNYIRANGATYRSPENDARYLQKIKSCVETGKPVEMFFLSFCPKYRNEEITNGQIYPDMGNLVSFTHLLTISKNLSQIYEPGIKFIVGLETDIYKSFGKHSQEEIDTVNAELKNILAQAEDIVGVKGQNRIELVNVLDLVNEAGPKLHQAITDEIKKVTDDYNSGKIKADMDEWIEFYKTTTSPTMFSSEVEKDTYALKQAIFYYAFNNVKYLHGEGITKNYPNAINATVRGTKTKATIKLMPEESHFPHHGICTRETDGRWHIRKFADYEQQAGYFIPRFYKDYKYPFYYEQVVPQLPEHDLNSLKCHTQFVDMANGEKIVLKFSTKNEDDGTQILTKEIDRIQQMEKAGISIVPHIIYSRKQKNNTAYAMPFIEGNTLQEVLLDKNLKSDDFEQILNDFLKTLSNEMYSKGIETKPDNYLADIHGGRINDIAKNDEFEVKNINGKNLKSPKDIASYLQQNYDEIEQSITSPVIPSYTHGDLHFRNVIYNRDKKRFKLIDINGRRPINSVETEMSRLLLSFDAYIIRNGLIDSKMDKNGELSISYSDEAKRVLALKNKALMLILSNPHINKWFKDIKNAEAQIKLLEAVHVIGVFNKRKDVEKLNTYALGTVLLNEAAEQVSECVKNYKNEQQNTDGIITSMLQDLDKNPEDTNTYKKVMLRCMMRLSSEYDDYAFVNFKGAWLFRLTDKNGRKVVKGLANNPQDIPALDKNKDLITYDDDKFMHLWQAANFPENGYELITQNYSEKELWNSLFARTPLKIGNQEYKITDILGIGKESKAFRTADGKVIKVGLQSLKREYDYARQLADTDVKNFFPEYNDFDNKRNFIVMEEVKGQTAEQALREADTPLKKVQIIRDIYEAVKAESSLFNNYGLFAGQFNLRNVILSPNGIRIIDPFFEGSPEMYEAKQVCRMNAVLPQKMYNLDPGYYPLKVKSAKQKSDIAKLQYPNDALQKMANSRAGIPLDLENKLKQTLDKYLRGDISRFNLADMENDAVELAALAALTEQRMSHSKLGFVFDINGTIEHNGQFSKETVNTLNLLIERGIPVAFITGKRYSAAAEILSKMGIKHQKVSVYAQNGASCYEKGKLVYQEVMSEKSRQEILEKLADLTNDRIRYDESRVNILLNDINTAAGVKRRFGYKNDVEIISCKNGQEIEFLSKGINKSYALKHFAQRNNLNPEHIVRIGNEPNGNDVNILNGRNAIIIQNPNQIEPCFVGINEAMATGSIQIARPLQLSDKFNLRDFRDVEESKLDELSQYAQENAQLFYPAFAIKDRLSAEDKKRLDYKWVICDNDKPIGFTFIYEHKDNLGKYNMGMYISPDYTHQGLGKLIINKVFEFAESSIDNFKGIQVRVAENNKPSNGLVQKCGFVKIGEKPNDYTLFDEQGKAFEVGTNIYEKLVSTEAPQHETSNIKSEMFIDGEDGKPFELPKDKKIVINFSGGGNVLTKKSLKFLEEYAIKNAKDTKKLFGFDEDEAVAGSTYYTREDFDIVHDLPKGITHEYVQTAYKKIFQPLIINDDGQLRKEAEIQKNLQRVVLRGNCWGGAIIKEIEASLKKDLATHGFSEKKIKDSLRQVKVYMTNVPLELSSYPEYFSGVSLLNAADGMLKNESIIDKKQYDEIMAKAKFTKQDIADYSSEDPQQWIIPEERKISKFKQNNIRVYVANKSDMEYLPAGKNISDAVDEFITSKFGITKGDSSYKKYLEHMKTGHGTSFLFHEMREEGLRVFRNMLKYNNSIKQSNSAEKCER